MAYDLRVDMLTTEESEHVYAVAPELEAGYFDYCPTCHKTGTYRWAGDDHPCDCEMQLQLAKHYTAAGISKTLQRLDWDDYKSPVPPGIQEYRDDIEGMLEEGLGIVLAGDKGTGKTMLATLMLKEFIKLGYSCYSTTFSSTVEAFTAGWGNNPEAKKWFQHKFMDSQVLLLDDLGKEFRSKTGLSATTFDHILRTRANLGRPTLITTNMNGQELESGYGGSVLSLIIGQSVMHYLSGEDYRSNVVDSKLRARRAGETRPIR